MHGGRRVPGERGKTIWLGDFNRHHPMWDEERNTHLFTKAALEAAQPLLDMISRYDMQMVLPKDIPTLEVCMTKNFTRVDNIFCSTELHDSFISCDTMPQWRPQKTDHMPIIAVMEIEPERAVQVNKHNFRMMDWMEFRKMLGATLSTFQDVEELTSEEELLERIERLDSAIKMAIKEQVPVAKGSPYVKIWWTINLTKLKKHKEKLARKAYRKREVDGDLIHEEFRVVRNRYSEAI